MEQNTSSILLAGDFCADGLWDRLDRSYARKALAPMRDILSDADLRVVNLENAVFEDGPLTAQAITKQGPALYALPENLAFLEEGRFECAILTNNHVGDFGEEGVLSTMRELDRRGIARVGAGENIARSYQPAAPAGHGHPLLGLRNVFTCEAHNELMTTFFMLLADGELKRARAMKEEILTLTKMPVGLP